MSPTALTQGGYLKQVEAGYRSLGYDVLPPSQFRKELGYAPDLVVRKDDEITIIEVMGARRHQKPSLRDLRERAEAMGYRFELKVVPFEPSSTVAVDDLHRVPRLISEAEELISRGKYDLSVLLSWIAIEISIRQVNASHLGTPRAVTSPGEIVRLASEFELIGAKDRLWLRNIADIRNRVTHGFQVAVDAGLAKRVLAYAKRIARRAKLYGKGRLAA